MNDRPTKTLAAALGLIVLISAVALIAAMLENRSRKNDGEYSLQFSSSFKPSLASRDDLGICVVIAMDVSGSMGAAPLSGGDFKYRQAAAALGKVVDVLERIERDSPPGQVLKVGLLRFDDVVETVMPLSVMDVEGIAVLRRLAENPATFKPRGSTAIGLALERGAELLSQSGTILRSLIIVTDGQNTAGLLPVPALEAIYADRNSASTPELPVYTNSTLVSFIGFDVDGNYFTPLSALGARVMSASNQDELSASLTNLLEADITKLEAPSLGGGASP